MFSNLISLLAGSPYIESDSKIIIEAIKKINPKNNFVFYELGSGAGKNLIAIEREFYCQAIGIEISPFYYLISKIKTKNNRKIKVIFSDISKIDFLKADIIYCYLYPKFMNLLEKKFVNELKKGTYIISNSFPINNLKPYMKFQILAKTIYIYKF